MIVKHLDDVIQTKDDIDTQTWNSRRLLLKKDGMGFSMHDTLIKEGTETLIWYRNHVEAVYCVEGDGEIEVVGGGTYKIKEGTLYALNGHEKHLLRANSQMRMICVFNPPLTGDEVHDADGVYPIVEAN
ncbi:ectoine synthase [Paenibacillus sp. Soil522]|uniref:ectoine synthase n=1 Tax=Paenibacillus sp. Soil522 TaxID=1736388 RepID=UPI0006F87B03|nr:ectoine synthase [Paenibacillus sp. Soil522]KRE25125.1 L-ectoine synthase [Paenibacillus sp. Soil522]